MGPPKDVNPSFRKTLNTVKADSRLVDFAGDDASECGTRVSPGKWTINIDLRYRLSILQQARIAWLAGGARRASRLSGRACGRSCLPSCQTRIKHLGADIGGD
jgi:hypothetical protein